MTENESILSTLQNGIVCATDDITREDLEMMVKCLEELEQYRAIGTVEELQGLKDGSIPIIHGKAELELHDREIRAKAIDDVLETLSKHDDILSVIPAADLQGIICVVEQLKGGAE